MNNKKKAFTLVELIVVITILAILGTIAFISLQGYSKDARDGVRISDIKNAETGLEIFALNAGKYPEPDDFISYTGSISEIKQGIVGKNVIRNMGLDKIIKDPLTNDNYVYSIFGNGQYYQLAVDQEDITTALIESTYASTPVSSIVKGNYKFDPTLPSLILVPSSVTGSGIFDPNVCFVMDGGKNTLNNCIEKRSEMNIEKYDKGLVGYWDMETIFNSGGIDYLKDLSGNDNYGLFSGGLVYNNSLTGGLLGKGLNFDGGFISLGNKQSTRITDEITMIALINIDSGIIASNLSILGKYGSANPGDLWYNMNLNHGFIDYGTVSCGGLCGGSTTEKLKDLTYYLISMTSDGINGKTYINGDLVNQNSDQANRYITSSGSTTELRIGSVVRGWTNYNGIIDDVKIYNRVLSDAEIRQQAKIAGF